MDFKKQRLIICCLQETHINIIKIQTRVVDFKISVSINRRNKISSNLEDTIKTIKQLDLIYICITPHQTTKEHTLFLSGYRTLIMIGPILSHGQVTEII